MHEARLHLPSRQMYQNSVRPSVSFCMPNLTMRDVFHQIETMTTKSHAIVEHRAARKSLRPSVAKGSIVNHRYGTYIDGAHVPLSKQAILTRDT